jgi:hypothetical protein
MKSEEEYCWEIDEGRFSYKGRYREKFTVEDWTDQQRYDQDCESMGQKSVRDKMLSSFETRLAGNLWLVLHGAVIY